jgi:hypothetical protein
MRRTVRIEQTFRGDDNGVTIRIYEVHPPAASKRGDDVCVSLVNLARAERAMVYAAVAGGMFSPSVIAFARRAIGMTRVELALQMSANVGTVIAWEKGDARMNTEERDDLVALLEQSDRGNLIARRVL